MEPLLFTLYINDLPSIPSFSLPFLFADDTKCCTRILSLNDSSHLQADLDAIHTWSLSSSLTFNISKCCLLCFSNRSVKQISSTYFFNGDKIPSLNQCRDLGVIFSSNLSWSHHHDMILAKAYKQLGLIRRTFSSSMSVRAKKILYLTLVRSQVTYCSQIWKPHLIKDITRLEKLQRWATKFILNDFSSDYKTRLTSLHLLPLMYLYELFDILFFVKSFKYPEPSFQISNFVSFSSTSTRSGSAVKLIHKHSRTSLAHHSYFHRLVYVSGTLCLPLTFHSPFLPLKTPN